MELETIRLQGMTWSTKTGQYAGVWWLQEGAGKPTIQIVGDDWEAFQDALSSFYMTMEDSESEIKGGHPEEGSHRFPPGDHAYKTDWPYKWHWVHQSETWWVEIQTRRYDELAEELDARGIDIPDKSEFKKLAT